MSSPYIAMALADLFSSTQQSDAELCTTHYFFHDIHIVCHTNAPAIQAALHTLLACFPATNEHHGVLHCYIACYDSREYFPLRLPAQAQQHDTLQLVTNTQLSLYTDVDSNALYQHYAPQAACNGEILSVLHPQHHTAFIQLERAEQYTATFLRRYVFLLALGELLRSYDFVPYHAAALTAPGHDDCGILIPGDSGSGKTTLSLSCASTNYGLLGDDLVLLRLQHPSTLSIYAILPEIAVRTPSLALLPRLAFLHALPTDMRDKRYCTIEELRPGAMRLITQPRILLFPTLTDHTTHLVQRLGQAATLQRLVQHSISSKHTTRTAQEQLFSLLTALATQSTGYQVEIARGKPDLPQLIHSLVYR